MRIGLSYDLKEAMPVEQDSPDDALEEYDSPETVEIISAALEAKGHSVVRLGGGSEFIDNIRREKVDIVFNIAEGRGNYRSREAQVPSILEMLDIPYTGSDPQCLAICLDKPVTKKLVAVDGVSTPKWLVIASKEELVRYPGTVSPSRPLSSRRMKAQAKGFALTSVVNTPEQAAGIVPKLLEYYRQPVMVEEFIDGDEVTVGIIG